MGRWIKMKGDFNITSDPKCPPHTPCCAHTTYTLYCSTVCSLLSSSLIFLFSVVVVRVGAARLQIRLCTAFLWFFFLFIRVGLLLLLLFGRVCVVSLCITHETWAFTFVCNFSTHVHRCGRMSDVCLSTYEFVRAGDGDAGNKTKLIFIVEPTWYPYTLNGIKSEALLLWAFYFWWCLFLCGYLHQIVRISSAARRRTQKCPREKKLNAPQRRRDTARIKKKKKQPPWPLLAVTRTRWIAWI